MQNNRVEKKRPDIKSNENEIFVAMFANTDLYSRLTKSCLVSASTQVPLHTNES